MVSVETLLKQLPEYKDDWVLIKEDQKVKDIIKQIQLSHKKFAAFYDNIALYFDDNSISKICDNLFNFCKKNIAYKEEPVEDQTTALPTGILFRQYGDCKHYAGFCGGILDALNRIEDRKINWCYRFASYDFTDSTPHHVFIVVYHNDEEIWIDPVPGSDKTVPTWFQDRTIKSFDVMALSENIAGVSVGSQSIGTKSIDVHPMKTHDLNFDNAYPGFADVWKSHGSQVLTLAPGYGGNCDSYNGWNIHNLPQLTQEINAEIATGPEPHTVTADLVDWIWKSNVRSWNFYYRQGVAPDVIQIANEKLPAAWPRPIVSPDGRLTFDKFYNIGECHNPYIHLLTGAIQKMLNQYLGDNSYIISPNQPVEYMNYQHPGEFNKVNMFNQIRGDNFFQAMLKVVKDVFIAYAELQMKVALTTPRNSFMGIIAVNLFKWATHLNQDIANGEWPQIAAAWKGLGGNPDRLLQAIEKGSKEPAIDEHGNSIAGAPAAAAYITAAIPVIALMLKYLDKSGKASEIVAAAEPLLELQFPEIDWKGLKNGMPAIDRASGQPVQFIATDPDGSINSLFNTARKNPIPIAACVGLGTYLLLNRNGKKKNYLIPALAAGATYFFLSNASATTLLPGTGTNKLSDLINWVNSSNDTAANKAESIAVFNQMSADEIDTTYEFVFNYILKNKPVPEDSVLYQKIQAIIEKYNVFS